MSLNRTITVCLGSFAPVHTSGRITWPPSCARGSVSDVGGMVSLPLQGSSASIQATLGRFTDAATVMEEEELYGARAVVCSSGFGACRVHCQMLQATTARVCRVWRQAVDMVNGWYWCLAVVFRMLCRSGEPRCLLPSHHHIL